MNKKYNKQKCEIKILSLLTLLLCSFNAFSQTTFQYQNLFYKINFESNSEVTVTADNSYKELSEIEIPQNVTYNEKKYTVTKIESDAFYDCINLQKIVIPISINEIGSQAFKNCTSLESINIPNDDTKIWAAAFYNCENLKIIKLPDNLETIYENTFYKCKSLTTITIPESVTLIGLSAFSKCENLESINIPKGITNIDNNCFNECTSLSTITLPNNITRIGKKAFNKCTNLGSIKIPDNVTNIEESAFANCSNLYSINIPNGITKINDYTFESCKKLTSIDIPNSVNEIGKNSFWSSGLTSITIPNSVTIINRSAFKQCTKLESVILSDNTKSVVDSAFYYCTALSSITFPKKVNSIGKYACKGCSNLKSITILNDISSNNIGNDAFAECNIINKIINYQNDPVQANYIFGNNIIIKPDLYVPYNKINLYKSNNWPGNIIEMAKITLSVNNEDFGTIEGEVNVIKGEKAIYTAIPNNDYHFVKWNDENTDNPHEIKVNDNLELSAIFAEHYQEIIPSQEATCTKPGLTEGLKCSFCKKIIKQQEITTPALGHNYKDPIFEWTEYSKAVAKFVCTKDNDTQTIDGVIKSDTTIAPTIEKEGELTYTATFTFQGKPYTDTKTQTLEKLKKNNNGGGNGTPVSSVNQKSINIWSYDKKIYLDNVPLNCQIKIFDISGRLIKNITPINYHTEIPIKKSGIYIIRINNEKFKVII